MWKNPLMFFLFFIALNSYTSVYCFSGPISEEAKRKNVLALMVDEVAQTYFRATEPLTNEIPNFESSRLKLLLEGMHQTTENMLTLTTDTEWSQRIFKGNPTFHEIRQLTLFNLNKARQHLVKDQDKKATTDFMNFINTLNAARSYCDQLLLINGNIRNVTSSKKRWTAAVEKSASEKYEESMGADNIITSQWLEIMEWGGGRTATEELRLLGRKNQAVLVELKKKDRALVKTGAVEQVRVHTDTVDGVVYKYADFPPEKWSFIYTPDRDLVKGLVSWLVYINSGNSVKLSDVASLGISNAAYDANVYHILKTTENSRLITDAKGDQVRLQLKAETLNTQNFEEVYLKRVVVENDQIVYYGNRNEVTATTELQPLLVIEPVRGSLFARIKLEVEKLRLTPGEYNPSNLGLNTY